jgi:hypothetical protein
MLATHMNKEGMHQSRSRDNIRLISPSKVHVPWWIQGTVLELHHGFTTLGQPWRLGSSLSHLLGNSRTCSDRRLPSGASPSCWQLSNEWMDVAAAEAEAIYRGACRSKGVANRHENRLGRPAWALFGPAWPRFAPQRFLVNCWLAPLWMWALDIVFSTV